MFEEMKIRKFCRDNLTGNYPICIIDICKIQGFSYVEKQLDRQTLSCTICNNDMKVIIVNQLCEASLKRHLIAKELGYWVLYASKKKHYTNKHPYVHCNHNEWHYSRKGEKVCRFAMEILMPTPAMNIMYYLQNRYLGVDISNNRRIGLTMRQFSVPAEVAVERLRELKMLYIRTI